MGRKKKNNAPSYFDLQFITSSISTMLVLLLLGLVVFFVLAAGKLSVYVKENLTFALVLSDDLKDTDILRLQKQYAKEPFAKEALYISKEQALQESMEQMGTNHEEFLGFNPFRASIEIKLNSAYANSDSIARLETLFKNNPAIQSVSYQKDLIDAVNENIRTISIALLSLAVVLALISFALINNTIKLAIYSRRFLIHTMKLVGASWGFIRGPFIKKNVWSGIIAAVLANVILMSAAYGLVMYQPDLLRVITPDIMLVVMVAVVLFGISITFLCSYFSINKYLRMKANTLYYI